MSKYRIIECPGCGLPFREGRSLSQHFIWSPGCKQHATTLSNGLAVSCPPLHTSSGAVAPLHGLLPNDNEICDDGVSTGYVPSDSSFYYPQSDLESLDLDNDNRMDLIQASSEDHLQNVVSFPVAFSNSALHEVELLKLLHQIGAPNHAFPSLMSWARKANENNYHFQPTSMCYESQIRNLTQLVGLSPCRPTITKVSLEPDNLVLDVVVFPFASMLASLLNCPMLNKIENLVVNPEDRYGRCHGDRLGEVNSAQWYQDTYDRMITNPDKEFLCPIIFAMDKTVISEISHLSVNVILFSTSLFNQNVSMLCNLFGIPIMFILNFVLCLPLCRLEIKVLLGAH
jgi:hypothetical protein